MNKTIFITGTDTNVGKTVLTGLLIAHLRSEGVNALAVKPFCSEGRGDAEFLWELQDGNITLDEINPLHYDLPVAPYVAAWQSGITVTLKDALQHLRALQSNCDILLVEGAGGVMVPLAEDLLALDLMKALDCHSIIVGKNQLGIINHMLLTANILAANLRKTFQCVLMNQEVGDASHPTNAGVIEGLLKGVRVENLPYLGQNASNAEWVKKNQKNFQKTLARLAAVDIVCRVVSSGNDKRRTSKETR